MSHFSFSCSGLVSFFQATLSRSIWDIHNIFNCHRWKMQVTVQLHRSSTAAGYFRDGNLSSNTNHLPKASPMSTAELLHLFYLCCCILGLKLKAVLWQPPLWGTVGFLGSSCCHGFSQKQSSALLNCPRIEAQKPDSLYHVPFLPSSSRSLFTAVTSLPTPAKGITATPSGCYQFSER